MKEPLERTNYSKHQRYSRAYEELKNPAVVFEFAELLNGHVFVNEKGAQFKVTVEYAPSQCVPKPCSRKDSREGTIFKVPNKNLTSPITCDPRKQYYQQESAKLRQQIQMSQNSNRHLMGDSLSSLTLKELKQLENRLEQGITRIRSKKIAEMDRFQRANTVTGQELNAIHALASRNFFSPAIIEGGGTAYSHPDKKILHLG
ncbi:Agamous-like MADS-box protein AGL11 [Citrus sinensis]|uniref:Agamous-like MADS-box protein AGL11 n=2 Tax=Citrus sinensis TaxID=2711 RepID=A0ACB8M7T6_CITSI|nr:Agamous-like MADS-box protein AGL11 [Citrus sinensis]KAH9781257.1 Agamous-like MADS-box protein AGL11 [Citrus sinensis]